MDSTERDLRITIARMRRQAYELFIMPSGELLRNADAKLGNIMDYAGSVWDGRTSAYDKMSYERPSIEELVGADAVPGYVAGERDTELHRTHCGQGKACNCKTIEQCPYTLEANKAAANRMLAEWHNRRITAAPLYPHCHE